MYFGSMFLSTPLETIFVFHATPRFWSIVLFVWGAPRIVISPAGVRPGTPTGENWFLSAFSVVPRNQTSITEFSFPSASRDRCLPQSSDAWSVQPTRAQKNAWYVVCVVDLFALTLAQCWA